MSGKLQRMGTLPRLWSQISKRPLVRDTIVTTVLSTAGKAAGFLIPFFIAAWFGVTGETDAFFFAYGVIIFLAMIFSPVIEIVIVPFIVEGRMHDKDIGKFVGGILVISALGLIILSAVFLVSIKPVLSVFAKFSEVELNLIHKILLEATPLLILLVWTSILAGTLNAYKVFAIPALSPAFRALATLFFIFLFKDKIGVHAIAWGYVVGELWRFLILFLLLKRLNLFCLTFSIRLEHKLTEFLRTSSYLIIGMSIIGLSGIINRIMASWLGQGNVSLIEYAERLYMIPTNLLSGGLIVTILSHWCERYYEFGKEKLDHDVSKTAIAVGSMGLLFTIIFFLARNDLVELAYGHGKFTFKQIEKVKIIFTFYLLGLTPYLLSYVYERAFLTRKETKVLLYGNVLRIMGTVLCNWIFMRFIEVSGIALSTSLVALLYAGLLRLLFNKKCA